MQHFDYSKSKYGFFYLPKDLVKQTNLGYNLSTSWMLLEP